MPALRAYLSLRALLLGRLLREVGWLRLAVLGPVLVALGGRVLEVTAGSVPGQWALAGSVVLTLTSAHRQRADLRFLCITAPGYRPWLAVEYGLLAVPGAVALLAMGNWAAGGVVLALAPLAVLVPAGPNARSTRQRVRSVFRSEAFEWVSSLRQGGLLLWPLLVGAAMWQHQAAVGPVLALAGWLLRVVGSYGVPEPATMLALAARTPGQFLRRRLVLGVGYAGLTAAPLLWLLGWGPAGVGGGAAGAVGGAWLGLVALVILTKYAFYPNTVHIRVSQGLVVALGVAGVGHPAYPPLLLVVIGGLVWQSQRRLRAVLGNAVTTEQ